MVIVANSFEWVKHSIVCVSGESGIPPCSSRKTSVLIPHSLLWNNEMSGKLDKQRHFPGQGWRLLAGVGQQLSRTPGYIPCA